MNITQIIKDRLDIVDLVSRYVKLERRGSKMLGLCPFHHEKTPSFSVSPGEGYYHCFGCKKSGDVFSFVMEMEKKDFSEVLEEFAGQLGLDLPRHANTQEVENKSLFQVMTLAKNWFVENLHKLSNKRAKDYLLGRGFSLNMIDQFELGFVPEGRSQLSEFLMKQQISLACIVDCGLAVKDENNKLIDRFKNRIIFPIYNEKKQLVGFGGRLIEPGVPKYLNSPETMFFKKKEILYNLDKAKDEIRRSGQAYVVEGYVDVLALSQAGVSNVVATLGTALTEQHLEKLWKYCSSPTICMDGDEAGRAALFRAAHLAIEHISEGKSVDFVLLPQGMDPDELLKAKGAEFTQSLLTQRVELSQLLWEFELSKLTRRTPEEIALFEKDLWALTKKIKNDNVRAYYVKFFKDKIWHEFKKTASHKQINSKAATSYDTRIKIDNTRFISDKAMLSLLINHPIILSDKQIYEDFCSFQFALPSSDQIRGAIIALAEGNEAPTLTKDKILGALSAQGIEFESDMINLNTNFELCAMMWGIMMKKHLADKIEHEYTELVLKQDEASFCRAQILRDEVLKLKEEIYKLHSDIEDKQLQ